MPEVKKNSLKIFLVEDDMFYAQILEHHITMNPDFDLDIFHTGKDVLNNLYRKPDVICMDFGLPDIQGEQLFREIINANKEIPIIVISAQEEIGVAVSLLKQGARDYIIKDNQVKENLWKALVNVNENLSLKKEVETLKQELCHKYSFEKSIVGQSEAVKNTFVLLNKAIRSNINVSISGETGTGKEVYAKAIHFNSERKKKPFVAVNMGAIPKELIESELFGHEKGAFTSANSVKLGKFEEANGGTLFLDEIAELDINLQSKLLRAIQEREIVRVGGNKVIKVDIRLITATHKNLSDEVSAGRFREDLFFRIVGLPIVLPALRNRGNDVLILAKYFLSEYANINKTNVLRLSEKATTKLKRYSWPGNIRELKAVIELACIMAEGKEIQEEDLVFYQIGESKGYTFEEKSLKEFENEIIYRFLKKYDDNVLLVADKLKIGKSKIYNIIKSGEIEL